MRTAQDVTTELKRRARKGLPLNSGANRGDWLYAMAVKLFGSWGGAVKAAGFDYGPIKLRGPLTAKAVIEQIKALAASKKRLLATDHGRLARAAVDHFGSWRKALKKTGHDDANLLWTGERVVEHIKMTWAKGLPVNSAQIMYQNRNLYSAGRRRFGTWAAALETAFSGEVPAIRHANLGRRRGKARGTKATAPR